MSTPHNGPSVNPVEEMLCRWAAAKLDVPREDVLSVEFRHEDGYGNDSGTYWPEENTAVVKLRSIAKGEPKRPRKRTFSVDGMEGLPGLIREIVGFSDEQHGEEPGQPKGER